MKLRNKISFSIANYEYDPISIFNLNNYNRIINKNEIDLKLKKIQYGIYSSNKIKRVDVYIAGHTNDFDLIYFPYKKKKNYFYEYNLLESELVLDYVDISILNNLDYISTTNSNDLDEMFKDFVIVSTPVKNKKFVFNITFIELDNYMDELDNVTEQFINVIKKSYDIFEDYYKFIDKRYKDVFYYCIMDFKRTKFYKEFYHKIDNLLNIDIHAIAYKPYYNRVFEIEYIVNYSNYSRFYNFMNYIKYLILINKI